MNSVSKKSSLSMLTLGALGVVFGDIGTSPIYALRQSLDTSGTTVYDIYGVVSLIFWSLMLVVSLKYLAFVLRADNNGEGGILSLFALLPHKVRNATTGSKYIFIVLLMLGTALLVADGMLTPAISVLSAVEGLELITPTFKPIIIPISLAIIVGLFVFQKKGTASVGALFGPIMVVWFTVLAILGLSGIVEHPEVLFAINPLYGIDFLLSNPLLGFLSLGSVVLCVTGAEALYADMGHFGKMPIQVGWLCLVMPTLVLNYFGQGALLLSNPAAIDRTAISTRRRVEFVHAGTDVLSDNCDVFSMSMFRHFPENTIQSNSGLFNSTYRNLAVWP